MNKNDEIDILQLLFSITKHRRGIIIFAILGLVAGIIINITSSIQSSVNVEYVIKSSIAISSQNKDGLFTSNNVNPNSTDIKLAENMVDSVIYVIKSDKALAEVIDDLGLIGVSVKSVKDAITLKQYNNTQIIDISLKWKNAQEGIDILSTIMDVVPHVLIDTLKLGSVTVINEPTFTGNTKQGINIKQIALPCIAGVMLVVAYAVLEFLLNPTLLNPDDTQHLFKLDAIGIIPNNDEYYENRVYQKEDDDDPTYNMLQEVYATTTHILLNRISEKNINRVSITSSVSQEGKSVTTSNIAVQLSKLQYKVLMLDMDLRHPNLSRLFTKKTDHEKSLNAVYYGETYAEDAVIHISEYLDLLPTRLEKQRMYLDVTMFEIIEQLSDKYDYIIMDTAPIGQVSDIMKLKSISSDAVFVIKHDYVSVKDIKANISKLERAGFWIAGCVVNNVSERLIDKIYHNGYDSKYYYTGSAAKKKQREKGHKGLFRKKSEQKKTETVQDNEQ